VSAWDDFYRFWVSEQQLPGNVVPDGVVALGAYLIGKFKIAPWLKERHKEHLEHQERQHQEVLAGQQAIVDAHKRLFDLHERHHKELLDAKHEEASAIEHLAEQQQQPPDSQ